jgi:membrane fusion protein (multidrug efflux system)
MCRDRRLLDADDRQDAAATGAGPDGAAVHRPAEPSPGPEPPRSAAVDTPRPHRSGLRRFHFFTVLAAALIGAALWAWPRIVEAFTTVSTDDAYVAGHVTYVASRVPGTIQAIHVDDNHFVEKGKLLVELDPEPYQVVADKAAAGVAVAEGQLAQAQAQGRAVVAGIRGSYNNLKLAMDQVEEQEAKLNAAVATLEKARAQRVLAEAELRRAQNLLASSSGTQQVMDQRQASYQVALATELEAHEQVHLARAALGLPPVPTPGEKLGEVPADWHEKAPLVRASLAELINNGVKIGLEVPPIEEDPDTVYDKFMKRAPGGNLDAFLSDLVESSPAVQLARANRDQAHRALEQARLDLRDTKIHAEIAGFVSRRVANPGNRVQAGQRLMALRSLEDVWIDANFKETQLSDLRIGQPVEIRADAYPGRVYRGRVSGFGAGTGASTALLPPENATGNFVKVVQRLPVRIDLVDGNPPEAPLFIGLSVEPVVKVRERPEGPFAGQKLRRPVGQGPMAATAPAGPPS